MYVQYASIYLNRSPAQVGCMRQVLWPGALGRYQGVVGGGRGDRDGEYIVNPWLIHVEREVGGGIEMGNTL